MDHDELSPRDGGAASQRSWNDFTAQSPMCSDFYKTETCIATILKTTLSHFVWVLG